MFCQLPALVVYVALLGDVAVSLSDARERDVAIETLDNADNTFQVMFVPELAGHVTAKVFFADTQVPGSPFVIDVEPQHPSAEQIVDDQPDSGSFRDTSSIIFLFHFWLFSDAVLWVSCEIFENLEVPKFVGGGSVAEWLACWTQAQKGLVSNRSREAVW